MNSYSSYIAPPFKILAYRDVECLVRRLERQAKASPLGHLLPAIQAYYACNAEAKKPAAVETGTLDYYEDRHDEHARFFQDFVRDDLPAILKDARFSSGETPAWLAEKRAPSYFLRFGAVNVKNFSRLGLQENKLQSISTSGALWRNNTLKALQESIELLLERRPDLFVFASLFDQENFNGYCMDSHVKAYEKSGVNYLPFWDAMIIGVTAVIGGLLESAEGISQSLRVVFRDATRAPFYSITHFFHGAFDGNNRRFNENVLGSILGQPENRNVDEKAVSGYMASVYSQMEWPKPRLIAQSGPATRLRSGP